MQKSYRFFYRVLRYLRKRLFANMPIQVRRVNLQENDGYCTYRRDKFLVFIDKRLPEYYAIDVLIHEMAHALSWDQDEDVHGPNWGLAYSKVYQTYLELEN